MEIENLFNTKKIQRKSFFIYSGVGFLAVYSIKNVFKYFFAGNTIGQNKNNITIKLNPFAVKRDKAGSNNV
ncbi:MAG: hypothetical protein Q8903_01445 [Bacteroidota bacterium]|nr:hypothetical protein [Bacteroidota bacterium]